MAYHLIAESGPLKGLLLSLDEGDEWIIGRDPELSDFFLNDSTVSRKHVSIKKTGDGYEIKNFSRTNPAQINGEDLSGSHLLKLGDEIIIGQNHFIFSDQKPKKKSKKSSAPDTAFDAIFDEEMDEELPPIGMEEEPEEIEPDDEESEEIEEEEEQEPEEKIEEKTAYDTIFEEPEKIEELPFDLSPDKPLILKVITGPNAGAEFGLEKNTTYVIGKDSKEADIVLSDLSVSKAHAKLELKDGKMILEDLGSKNGTMVKGALITEPISITPQDVVSMGTTTFLIIDKDRETETIYAPKFETYEEPEEGEVQEEKLKTEWKKEAIPTKFLVYAGSIFAIFLIVFMSFFSLFKAEKHTQSFAMHQGEVKRALKPYNGITYSYAPSSGKLFLAGHVLNPVKHEELMYTMNLLPYITEIEDNLIIDSLVSSSINRVLVENLGFKGVSIHAPEAGQFVINGYLNTAQDLEELDDYLLSNFTYLDRLKNNVVVENELAEKVGNLIISAGFSTIRPSLTNGLLVLNGRYVKKSEAAYHKLVKDLSRLNGIRDIRNLAVISTERDARIDITKKYQVTGFAEKNQMNYSVVINGQILTLNEHLDGMKITKILTDTIFLEKDGLKYKIDYTR